MTDELDELDELEISLLEKLEEEPYEIPTGEDVYDHGKTQAFMCEVIDLAQERGLNLLELREACEWAARSCSAQIAAALEELASESKPVDVAQVADGVEDDAADLDDGGGDEERQGDARADDGADGLGCEEQTHHL